MCPVDCISNADATWLRPDPEFEILRSIVVLDPVAMMHGFFGEEMAIEKLFHHEDMLEHVPVIATRTRMFRHSNHDVAGLVSVKSTFPIHNSKFAG